MGFLMLPVSLVISFIGAYVVSTGLFIRHLRSQITWLRLLAYSLTFAVIYTGIEFGIIYASMATFSR
jgi:hypothetical protein